MLTIKLTFKEVMHLHMALQVWERTGTGPHYDLLTEHWIIFLQQFEKLASKQQKTYRVKFNSLQALAFLQLWLGFPLSQGWAKTVMDVIQIIDQESKAPKVIAAA